jgi:ADP-heptose:LPS heptosyltransferase
MSLPEKRWPPARFARVMDRLVETREATVVLVGGPDDVAVSRQVLHAASELTTSSTVDLTSRLSIGETAALIETSDLYVGNDSGVAHLASAVGTPVVVVFGPTDPRRYGPVPGAGLAVAPSPDDGAVVDRLSEARGSTAIEAVSVEDVWRAVDSLLPAA